MVTTDQSELDPLDERPPWDQINTLRDEIIPTHSDSFFMQSAVPRFILHVNSGVFIQVNDPFPSLFGYSREQLLNGTVRAPDLLEAEDRNPFQIDRPCSDKHQDDVFRGTAIDKDGNPFPARVSISAREIMEQRVLFGSVRDVSDDRKRIRTLKKQKEEAFQTNKQLRRLKIKLQSLSGITTELLTVTHKLDVFTKVKTKLCELTEMNFRNVTFFLLDEEQDQLKPPLDESEEEAIPMDSSHPATELVNGISVMKQPDSNTLLLPLEEGNNRFGVLRILMDPDDRALLEKNQPVWKAFQEILNILSDLIGLFLHRCHLYKKKRLQSIHDPLTGLYNRKHFNRKLKQECSRVKRYDTPLSLMIIDVDNFKRINDEYGHQQGDYLIQQIAQTLNQSARNSDILCRYGGDEFALLLPSTDGPEAELNARNTITDFQKAAFTVKRSDGSVKLVPVDISIGVSSLPRSSSESNDRPADETVSRKWLLNTADRCMFEAKDSDDYHIIRFGASENHMSAV